MPGERQTLIADLEERARRIRAHVVRIAGMSDCHTGGSLSIADLIAALYFHLLRVDPANPQWEGRDYFILSKGHTVPALASALAMRGFFSEDELVRHLQLDSLVPGHACARITPGVDVSTGSLGHGLPIGVGLALGVRMDGAANRVVVMLGDGELQEGSNWEAAMSAAHHRLDNLVAIIDRNRYQTGPTEKMMSLEPLAEKWAAFGWSVRVIDGHDMPQIVETLDDLPFEAGRPSAIVAETVKGKGVSLSLHHHMDRFNEEQVRAALAELGETQ
jgi:transketolase